jgi:hypothetical protein
VFNVLRANPTPAVKFEKLKTNTHFQTTKLKTKLGFQKKELETKPVFRPLIYVLAGFVAVVALYWMIGYDTQIDSNL